jgi:DNA polymerase-3 subunit delta
MAGIYASKLGGYLQNLPSVVVLWGEDGGAIRQAAQQVIEATGVDMADPFAAEKLTLNDLSATPTRLAESSQTLSFTSPHRVILISGISGDEPATTVAALTQAVKDTLAFPLSAVTIVIPAPKLFEKTSALIKAVEAHAQGLAVRFMADSERDIASWLQNELKASGKAVEPEAMHLLSSGLGADRDVARREVEKLLLYVGDDPVVTAEHVQASLAGATPADVFRLAESVLSRNAAQTDHLLQQLLQQGEDLNAAFSITLKQLQTVKTAQQMQRDGQPDNEILRISGKFRAPPFAQQAFLAQVKGYPSKRLAGLASYAVETLSQARSGLVDGNLVFQRALLALSA